MYEIWILEGVLIKGAKPHPPKYSALWEMDTLKNLNKKKYGKKNEDRSRELGLGIFYSAKSYQPIRSKKIYVSTSVSIFEASN